MTDDIPGDDPLDELGRELRQTDSAAELRADAEERERLAAQSARRRAGLADVARDAMFRGDRLALHYPHRTVTGEVEHATNDLVTVRTATGPVHCDLNGPVSAVVVERDATAGRTPERGAESFRARCYELELRGAEVEVGGALPGGAIRGRLEVVAIDHLVVTNEDGAFHVALAAVHTLAEIVR